MPAVLYQCASCGEVLLGAAQRERCARCSNEQLDTSLFQPVDQPWVWDGRWKQTRLDGITWEFGDGQIRLSKEPIGIGEMRPFGGGVRFRSLVDTPVPQLPTDPAEGLALDTVVAQARFSPRVRRWLVFVVTAILTAAICFAGDIAYRDWTFGQLLEVAQAVEDPAVWSPYFELRECGPDPLAVTNSEDLREIVGALWVSAIQLREKLADGIEPANTLRIALWHDELATARQRIYSHELVWIEHLDRESAALAAIADLPFLRDQRNGFRAWTEFAIEADGSIAGTWSAARQAFETADGSTFGDHSTDVRKVFQFVEVDLCAGITP